MAVNVTVYDLDNYPDNSKTVTVDQDQVVPIGYEGDEQWVLSFSTTAYSDNTNTTAIQDIYVQEIKTGWLKSSGFVSGPFTVDSDSKTLGVKLDASSKWYYVELDEDTYGGNTLADHIEEKVRDIPNAGNWSSSDDQLAYMNASVEYKNGKFYIISGTVSPYYTGTNRSSVKVTASGSDTLHDDLGFNISVDSETIAGTSIDESLLAQNYTAGAATVYTNSSLTLSAGECIAITDGTNTDYAEVVAVSGTEITVPTTATNSFDGIDSSYTANEAKVQVLRLQDPEQAPVAYYDTVDGIIRWGIKSISNQIDFSS